MKPKFRMKLAPNTITDMLLIAAILGVVAVIAGALILRDKATKKGKK